jgi:hypothetical protein
MKAKSLKLRAWNLGVKSLLLCLIVFVFTAYAYAGTVRGKLERRGYAAEHVGVTLYNQREGRSSYAYTGSDGMYYLYNVPPGTYYLEIWIQPDREPLRYEVQVYSQPLTDIAPIVIP